MKSMKVIYSNFDETTGISTVTILTKIGEFTGTSKLHDEDKNISSSFAGCRYAEIRAIIKYHKKKLENINNQIKGLDDCRKIIENLKDYNEHSVENRKIRRRLYELKSEKQKIKMYIENLSNKLVDLMNQREKVLATLNKKRGE